MAQEKQESQGRWRPRAKVVALIVILAASAVLAVTAKVTRAQFKPIPDYVGIGAGLQFRTDINNHLSGVTPMAPRLVRFPFAQLPSEQDGQLYFCSDCQQTTPCQGGGSGAVAAGLGGVWTCGSGTSSLTTTFNANHNRMTNLGVNTAVGDALSQGQSHLNDLATASGLYSMGANRLTNLAADTATGDALSRGQSSLNSLAAPAANFSMNGMTLSNVAGATASGQPLVYGQAGAQLAAAAASGQPTTWGQVGAQFASRSASHIVDYGTIKVSSSSETSDTLSAPAGIANGNVLVAIVDNLGAGSESVTMSGFTQIRQDTNTNGSGPLTATILCKVANNESGNYSVSWNNSSFMTGAIIQVTGVTGCTADATSGGNNNNGSGSATAAAPAVTAYGDFVLAAGAVDEWNRTNSFNGGAFLWNVFGGAQVNYYQAGTGAQALTFSSNSGKGLVAQQVAFFSSTTTAVPLVQGGGGNLLGTLQASVNGVVNLKAPPFNAQCDGNTDDTAAIQAAYNAACANGAALEFPTTLVNTGTGGVGKCLTETPLLFECANGVEIYGHGDVATTLHPDFNAGPAIVIAPPNAVSDVGPITATSLLGGGVAMNWGTGGDAGNYAIDLKELTDTQSTSKAPLNGLATMSFCVEVENTSTTSSSRAITWSSSGLTGETSAIGLWTDGGSSPDINFHLQTTGGSNSLNYSGASFTPNAKHFICGELDNTAGNSCTTAPCMRLFLDGTQVAETAVTGTIVQYAPEEWFLGAGPQHFPMASDGNPSTNPWIGQIDSVQISSGVLYGAGGASFAVPTSKPGSISNPILLLNFDNNPANLPISTTGLIKADQYLGGDQGYGSGAHGAWTYIRTGPLLTGSVGRHVIHDLQIDNGGDDILTTQAVGDEFYNLSLTCNHVCLKAYNNNYNIVWNDSIVATLGEAGAEFGHNSFVAASTGVKISNGWAFEVASFDQSGGNWHGLFLNPQLGGALADIYFGEDSTFTGFVCEGCGDDSENNLPSVAAAWFEGGQPVLIGGDMQSLASGNLPAIVMTGNTNLLALNTHFEGGAPGGNPIIHFLTAPTGASSPTLINPVVNSVMPNQQGVALSDQPTHLNVISNGITLSAAPTFNGGLNHIVVGKVADPAAPSITVVGGTGSGGAGPYYVVCHDSNGGATNVSVASNTLANAPATLSASNYIQITWSAEAGCNSWDVLKGNTSTALATGLNASVTSLNDTGQATSAYTAPARNTTGDVTVGTMLLSSGLSWPLPGTVVNGASFYCPNCDPPANPPVACTSSGAKTGAWVHGLNSQWICTP